MAGSRGAATGIALLICCPAVLGGSGASADGIALLVDTANDAWGPAAVAGVEPLSDARVDLLAGDIDYDAGSESLEFTIDVSDLSRPGPFRLSGTAVPDQEYLQWGFAFTHAGQRFEVVAIIDKEFEESSDLFGCFVDPEGNGSCSVAAGADRETNRITMSLSISDANRELQFDGDPVIASGTVLSEITMYSDAWDQAGTVIDPLRAVKGDTTPILSSATYVVP